MDFLLFSSFVLAFVSVFISIYLVGIHFNMDKRLKKYSSFSFKIVLKNIWSNFT